MSAIKSRDETYSVIENALAGAKEPLTCADLMDRPEVRAAVLARFGKDVQISTNKLSDLLGFMWRKEIIDRFPAPASRTMARFAYLLKKRDLPETHAELKPIPPRVSNSTSLSDLVITEGDGEVILDFKQFTITIRPK